MSRWTSIILIVFYWRRASSSRHINAPRWSVSQTPRTESNKKQRQTHLKSAREKIRWIINLSLQQQQKQAKQGWVRLDLFCELLLRFSRAAPRYIVIAISGVTSCVLHSNPSFCADWKRNSCLRITNIHTHSRQTIWKLRRGKRQPLFAAVLLDRAKRIAPGCDSWTGVNRASHYLVSSQYFSFILQRLLKSWLFLTGVWVQSNLHCYSL